MKVTYRITIEKLDENQIEEKHFEQPKKEVKESKPPQPKQQLPPKIIEKKTGTDLLTLEELSNYLKVSKSWLYDRTSRNKIPHYKIGRYVRFDLKQINEWLKEQTA